MANDLIADIIDVHSELKVLAGREKVLVARRAKLISEARLAGVAQVDIARALGVTQPRVAQMGRQDSR